MRNRNRSRNRSLSMGYLYLLLIALFATEPCPDSPRKIAVASENTKSAASATTTHGRLHSSRTGARSARHIRFFNHQLLPRPRAPPHVTWPPRRFASTRFVRRRAPLTDAGKITDRRPCRPVGSCRCNYTNRCRCGMTGRPPAAAAYDTSIIPVAVGYACEIVFARVGITKSEVGGGQSRHNL